MVDDGETILNIILVILAFVAAGLIFNWGNYGDARELGQSICDQEYDMDFKSYSDHNLYCKNKVIANETIYDGIKIQIE